MEVLYNELSPSPPFTDSTAFYFVDLLSDAVVYYSLNAARRGTTENNPWGSGKLEPLGAFSVGILLLGTGGGVGFSVICSLMEIISSGGAEETIAAVLPTSSSLLGTDPHKASELFEAGSLITYAAIGISLTSMITKEALYHITL